jgi:hypothetical protein
MKMEKIVQLFLGLLVLSITCSCRKEIPLEKMIRSSNKFVVGHLTNNEVSLDTIYRGSKKWDQLIQFGQNNENGWTNSVVSYNFDFWAGQGIFRLSGWENGNSVVLSQTDVNRKTFQLTKEINKGELNFLIE